MARSRTSRCAPSIATLVGLILLSSCSAASSPAPRPPAVDANPIVARQLGPIQASGVGGAGLVSGDPTGPDLYLTQNRVGATGTLRFTCVECRLAVSGGGATASENQDLPFLFPTLEADSDVEVIVEDLGSGARARYVLHAVPKDLPAFSVTGGPSRTAGELFVTPFGSGTPPAGQPFFAMILGQQGEVRYYLRSMSGQRLSDFKRTRLPGGAVRYSYSDVRLGVVRILDGDFRVLDEVKPLVLPGRATADLIDGHDSIILRDGHYIIGSKARRVVSDIPGRTGTADVQAVALQEIRDGVLVSSWSSVDHPELYACSTDGNDFATGGPDYVHWNSVMIDTDGDLVVSFRHMDALVKIAWPAGTIRWIMGGPCDQFGLSAGEKFSHQHHARRMADGRLSLFDNGNATSRSRVLLLNVDEAGRRLAAGPAGPGHLVVAAPAGRASFAAGSAQILDDGTVLVGWGSHDDGLSDVAEIDPVTGAYGFQVSFARTATGDPTWTYRAVKYP